MSRRLLFAVVALIACLVGGTVQAGILARPGFNPAEQTLKIRIGALSEVAIPGTGGAIFLANELGVHVLQDSPDIWQSEDFGPGTSILTATPMLTKLTRLGGNVRNLSGTFATSLAPGENPIGPGFPGGETGFRGLEPLSGTAILGFTTEMNSPATFQFPLSVVGAATTTTTTGTLGNEPVTITGMSWVTGPVVITDINTKMVRIPGRKMTGVILTLAPTPLESVVPITEFGADANPTLQNTATTTRVTVSGTNNLVSSVEGGVVTLVSPIRINTGTGAGNIPGVVIKQFVIPEPGSFLLFVSAAASLVVIGRIRGRKNRES